MSVKKFVSKKSGFLYLMIFLLQFGTSKGGGGGDGKINSESGDRIKDLNPVKFSGRQLSINNRDSYAEAANSFGAPPPPAANGPSHGHGPPAMMMIYQVPQNSYGVPSKGYGQQGGYGNGNKDNSKDLIGLVGLLGLKGLLGIVPLIKKAILTLVALSPVLIPLTLLKILIILLKPTLVFPGRSLTTSDVNKHLFEGITKLWDDQFTKKFNNSWTAKTERNGQSNQTIDRNELLKWAKNIDSAAVFGREYENQCMQRIACEGLLRSIPRIFLKIVGENYPYRAPRKGRDTTNNDNANDEITGKGLRRKDLATIALNKLKRQQVLPTKQPNLTAGPVSTDKLCIEYKCTVLF